MPPERIAQWLERHPTLVGELSYRYDVTSDGKLDAAWRALMARYPTASWSVDTWINERWSSYGEIMALYRGWLAQLPADVADDIAYRNGERLFAPR